MKWEHDVVNLDEWHTKYPGLSYQYFLNKEGEQEWELVSVDNGIAYFKRELKPEPKHENELAKYFRNRSSLV